MLSPQDLSVTKEVGSCVATPPKKDFLISDVFRCVSHNHFQAMLQVIANFFETYGIPFPSFHPTESFFRVVLPPHPSEKGPPCASRRQHGGGPDLPVDALGASGVQAAGGPCALTRDGAGGGGQKPSLEGCHSIQQNRHLSFGFFRRVPPANEA